MEIKLGTPGRILKGENQGWYVFVEHHLEGDSYTIFITKANRFANKDDPAPPTGEGFDNWARNYASLEGQFEYFKWEIEWLDAPE